MAILQSCCFWKSVRKGSYASVIYTLVSALKLCLFEFVSIRNDKAMEKRIKPKDKLTMMKINKNVTNYYYWNL